MQIGPYKLKNNLVLAPMAGVTDRPFRELCKQHGAGMAVSEMVSSNSILWGSEKTKRRANHDGETEPKIVQIMGADPKLMAEAAVYNIDNGAQIIDINMGCPAKKVCNTLAGSALMKDEALVVKILEAIVKASNVPVTLKIRTGWDKKSKNAVNIAKIAENSGIQSLAVHGRTRACKYTGDAEYDTVRSVKQNVQIPVIANGDIRTPEKAKKVLDFTGADGIMIGRAAQGKPWIFREIQYYLETGNYLPVATPIEIKNILLQHLDCLYQFYGEETGVRIARKHLAWYSKGAPSGANFRKFINHAKTKEEQINATQYFFNNIE
ncbi:MAG: tRNA dihydrouridine synthase DusB [Methylococcales bacterium]|nr:tRNA dihydrouridine synthase DusB [Methylococcales bacterium]